MSTLFQALMNIGPLDVYLLIAALVFAEDALFIGFILPGETAAILGGVLAGQQHVQLWLVAMLVVTAAVVGDTVGYLVGRHFGPRILSIRMLARHQPKLDTARSLLARRGGQAVLLGRFTAFFRAVMPALAGFSSMPFRRFLAYNAAGGLVWGTAAVLLGFFAGQAYLAVARTIGHNITLAIILVIAVVVLWRVIKHRRHDREESKVSG